MPDQRTARSTEHVSNGAMQGEDDEALPDDWVVLLNDDEQYSLWPALNEVPAGSAIFKGFELGLQRAVACHEDTLNAANQIGRFFADHDCRRICIRRDDLRHD